jgi:hypothetical protein
VEHGDHLAAEDVVSRAEIGVHWRAPEQTLRVPAGRLGVVEGEELCLHAQVDAVRVPHEDVLVAV